MVQAGKDAGSFISKGAGVVAGLTGITAGSALTYATIKDLTTGEIEAGEAALKLTAGLGAATASGALAGSQFGTVGTIIGGVAGLTTSAITAFMGYKDGIESLNIPVTTLTDEISSLTQEVDANRQAHEQAVQSIKDTYEGQLVEAEYADKLSQQLKLLVDTNGQVKEGNEERVKFILGELNSALGTEYDLNGRLITKNGEVISSYEDLQGSIKDTIEAKKKEAEQQANVELYKESLKEQIQLERDKAKLQEEYAKAEAEYNELMAKGLSDWTLEHDESCKQIIQNYIDIANKLNETRDEYWDVTEDVNYYSQEMTDSMIESTQKVSEEMFKQGGNYSETLQNMLTNNKTAWEQNYADLNTATQSVMLAQSTTLDTYTPEIQQKWADMANNSVTDFLNGISQVEPAVQSEILGTVTTTQNLTPNMAEAWSNLANTSFTNFATALSKVDPATQDEILKAITTTQGLTGTTAQAWATLAQTSKDRYNNALSSLNEDTRREIQSAVDEINGKKGTAEQAGQGLADSVERGVNTINTTEAGKQAVNGVAEGINKNKSNWNLMSAISGLASGVVSALKNKLGIHSPSTVLRDLVGRFIPLGIAKGIDMETDSVYSSIEKLNKGIKVRTSDFSIDTTQFVDYGKISGNIATQSEVLMNNDITNKIASACYNAFVNAMKTEGIKTKVEIKPDKDGIFKAVQTEAEQYYMQTGQPAFEF